MKITQLSPFQQRLAVSSMGVPIFLGIIAFSFNLVFQPIFVLLVASFIGLALWEYYRLAEIKNFQPLVSLGLFANFAYVWGVYMAIRDPYLLFLPEGVLIIFLALSLLMFFKPRANPLINVAITGFGILYLTLPLTSIININYFFSNNGLQDGRWWLVYLLGVTKSADTGAYFIGKLLGKRKLAPEISPKKTVEGAIGGVLGAILSSFVFYAIAHAYEPHPPIFLTLWQSLWLGLVLSLIAQFGDLAESLLKRDADVKDSSQLPGLGGFLDIVDSLVFTAPALYLFLKLKFT